MNDEKIILQLFARNEEGLLLADRQYGKLCRAIARNILKSDEDAEECVSDGYLTLWNTVPPERPRSLCAYLSRIVRNLAFNRYKAERREKRGGGELALILDELSEVIPGGESGEDALLQKELLQEIEDFLRGCTQRERSIFVRRYFYAEAFHDIGKAFGMKETAVRMSLSRTREKLRTYLQEKGYVT